MPVRWNRNYPRLYIHSLYWIVCGISIFLSTRV